MKIGALATTLAVVMITGISFTAAAGPAGDGDSDGTFDVLDFCSADPQAPSPVGCDTDTDGYGNRCDSDFNNDGFTNLSDFNVFGPQLNTSGAPGFSVADMNCDGFVNLSDFNLFGPRLNQPPGPSGLSCAGDTNCQ